MTTTAPLMFRPFGSFGDDSALKSEFYRLRAEPGRMTTSPNRQETKPVEERQIKPAEETGFKLTATEQRLIIDDLVFLQKHETDQDHRSW